jgi:hypothetical protein
MSDRTHATEGRRRLVRNRLSAYGAGSLQPVIPLRARRLAIEGKLAFGSSAMVLKPRQPILLLL